MAKKGCSPGFRLMVEQFVAVDEAILGMIEHVRTAGLLPFFTSDTKLFPTALGEFFSNASVSSEGVISSKVNGVDIVLSEQAIADALGFPLVGAEDEELSKAELDGLLREIGYGDSTLSRLKTKFFPADWQLLANIVGKCLLCKETSHDAVSQYQFRIMVGIFRRRRVNFSKIILEDLKNRLSQGSQGRCLSIVLQHLLGNLLNEAGVNLNSQKRITPSHESYRARRISRPSTHTPAPSTSTPAEPIPPNVSTSTPTPTEPTADLVPTPPPSPPRSPPSSPITTSIPTPIPANSTAEPSIPIPTPSPEPIPSTSTSTASSFHLSPQDASYLVNLMAQHFQPFFTSILTSIQDLQQSQASLHSALEVLSAKIDGTKKGESCEAADTLVESSSTGGGVGVADLPSPGSINSGGAADMGMEEIEQIIDRAVTNWEELSEPDVVDSAEPEEVVRLEPDVVDSLVIWTGVPEEEVPVPRVKILLPKFGQFIPRELVYIPPSPTVIPIYTVVEPEEDALQSEDRSEVSEAPCEGTWIAGVRFGYWQDHFSCQDWLKLSDIWENRTYIACVEHQLSDFLEGEVQEIIYDEAGLGDIVYEIRTIPEHSIFLSSKLDILKYRKYIENFFENALRGWKWLSMIQQDNWNVAKLLINEPMTVIRESCLKRRMDAIFAANQKQAELRKAQLEQDELRRKIEHIKQQDLLKKAQLQKCMESLRRAEELAKVMSGHKRSSPENPEIVQYKRSKSNVGRADGEGTSGTKRDVSPPPPPVKVSKVRREQAERDAALAEELAKEYTKGFSQEELLAEIEKKKKEEELSKELAEKLAREEEAPAVQKSPAKRRLIKAAEKKGKHSIVKEEGVDYSPRVTRSKTGNLPRSLRIDPRTGPRIPTPEEIEDPMLEVLNDMRIFRGQKPIRIRRVGNPPPPPPPSQ